MLPSDVVIVNQIEDSRVDAATFARTPIIRVTFKVGTHGPFVERFPKDTFNAAVRDAKLTSFAQEVRTT